MLLNNRMLFLIVHYWEVMVDVWPVIIQVVTAFEIGHVQFLLIVVIVGFLFFFLYRFV